jgi:hypothetical protein
MEDYFLVNAAVKRLTRLGTGTHYGSVLNYPLFSEDSPSEEAETRTWYLGEDDQWLLDLVMNLGHEAGALLPTFRPLLYARGDAFLLQPKNNPLVRDIRLPRGPASTWALNLGEKQWSMADGHVIPEELLKYCTPEHRVRDNIWRFQPVLDHGATLTTSGRTEFQLHERASAGSSTNVVPREIIPFLTRYYKQSVSVVPWGMVVQQDIQTTCMLPDDLGAVPTIPDTHKLVGVLAISVPTAADQPSKLEGELFIGTQKAYKWFNLCSYHEPPSTTSTSWVTAREGVHLKLSSKNAGVNIVLAFAVMVAISKAEVIPRVVERVVDLLEAVPCFGLILPHSYTSPVQDASGLQQLDAQLWTALQSEESLEVILQPVLFEHTILKDPLTKYTTKVYPFDWKDILPPTCDSVVPVGEQEQHPWGGIDFVISTSIHLCSNRFAFMPSADESGVLSNELIKAGGILGLELMAHHSVIGDDENAVVNPRGQTVRMFGMSILVRYKED